MKTLKIEIPEGYEIDKKKSTFENIVFKEIQKGLPTSWGELKTISGFHVRLDTNIEFNCGLPASKLNCNVFSTEEQAKASIALAQLSQLRDVYRQGWVPNWENHDHVKHCIAVQEGGYIIDEWYGREQFLSFQSKKVAQEFLKNFKNLIEQARPLMS